MGSNKYVRGLREFGVVYRSLVEYLLQIVNHAVPTPTHQHRQPVHFERIYASFEMCMCIEC